MPIRKKKGKKKSLGKSNDDEPSTLVSGDETHPKKPGSAKKRRKGKKTKLSKSEKANEKLDKASDKLKENKPVFHDLVHRMDQWLRHNSDRAVELFKKLDDENEGLASYDEFKSVLFDLDAPTNSTELHLLVKLLDLDSSGEIDYTELTKGLQYTKEIIELEKETEYGESMLMVTERNIPHCKVCKLGVGEPYHEKNPEYLMLDMKLLSFEGFHKHPGHFSILVHTHIPVIGLIDVIMKQTGAVTSKLSIFRDRSRSVDALLPLDSTLEECDLEGGSHDSPETCTLYYDYTTEYNECPLLLCDHYFSDNKNNQLA